MAEIKNKKLTKEDFPTLKIILEAEIAADFAKKAYEKFDKIIKSIVLFGSTIKKTSANNSDIDLIVIVDDASIKFDATMTAWYREELGKLLSANPYKKELHINTVKLTSWWQDILRGDPIALNIIRYGEEILDAGGFFRPLRILLQEGKMKATPEAIYMALDRAPQHLLKSKQAEMAAVEGLYWAMVDASQALLMSYKINASSPEFIYYLLKENFVDKNMMKSEYLKLYQEIFELHKGIMHGIIKEIKGEDLDSLQKKTEEFIVIVAGLIKKSLE
jgi:uncharacterized protein (UPF0332 family)/predicted nucleotidyltransferase